jgi:hypothetical protein
MMADAPAQVAISDKARSLGEASLQPRRPSTEIARGR